MLPNDIEQASRAEIGTAINPISVTDNVTDVVVAPITTTVSFDSDNDVSVLNLLYPFFDLLSFLYVSNQFLIVVKKTLKLFPTFNFFSNLCSKSIFSSGADWYSFGVFVAFRYQEIKQISQDKALFPYDKN